VAENLKNRSVLIVDNGLFVGLAERLTDFFGEVAYFREWKSAFPYLADIAPGEGIPGVTRVDNLFDAIDTADLIVFPDIYHGDLQTYLRRQGKRVWGAGDAEYLELDRVLAHDEEEVRGIEHPPTELVKGVSALRDYLSEDGDLWVKVSTFRGDMETFHHEKAFVTDLWLNHLEERYGPLAESVEFVVEEGVEGLEIGYDGYTVDGRYPTPVLWGVEVKDRGYVGRMVPYEKLPGPIREVNAAFAPLLAQTQCRSSVSFEMKVKPGDKPVIIDPCLRQGNPPTAASMELYGNLGDILWYGAEGVLVNPEPLAEYCAMLIIHSTWATKHWTPIHVPDGLRRWVKVCFECDVAGQRYYVPNPSEMIEFASVVALGDSLEEAVILCQERAEQVDGFQLDIRPEVLDEAQQAVDEVERSLT
jgi:hypothetical protein